MVHSPHIEELHPQRGGTDTFATSDASSTVGNVMPSTTHQKTTQEEVAKRKECLKHIFCSFDCGDEEELQEIEAFADVFNKLKEKYGEFSLIFKDEGAQAKIFEIVGATGATFICKIPHLFLFKEETLGERIQQEIALHRRFLRAHLLLKQKYRGTPKELLLNNIVIPSVHTATNNLGVPMIIMEKVPGRTVWYNIITNVFHPLFHHTKLGKEIGLENDKVIETFLYNIDEKISKKEIAKHQIFDDGLLQAYPNITVSEMLKESLLTDSFSGDVFTQIFAGEERGDILKSTYTLFNRLFKSMGLEHPDPHFRNFMITYDNKLGVIDFGCSAG